MEKLVLHEAGEGSEFGQVAAEYAQVVHGAQDVPDFALVGQDIEEDFAANSGVLEGAVDQPDAARRRISPRARGWRSSLRGPACAGRPAGDGKDPR